MENHTLGLPFRAPAELRIAAGSEQAQTANSHRLTNLTLRERDTASGDERTARAFIHRFLHHAILVNFCLASWRILVRSADLGVTLLLLRRRAPPPKPRIVAERRA